MDREFDASDYSDARDLANAILNNAKKMEDIFEKFDQIMNQMYTSGGAWESSGATQAEEAFQSDFHSRFLPFVTDVTNMNKHVNETINAYESMDNTATTKVTSV